MNEQSEKTPVNVPETPAPETPASEAIETAVAPAPDPAWVEEPKQVPNIFERLADSARSWLKSQTRQGWPLMVFLLLESVGGWTRICGPKMREKLRSLQAQNEACIDTINSHTSDKAKEAWLDHGQKLSKAIGGGNIAEIRGRTREEVEQDFDQKVRAAHAEMRRIYIETLPIAKTLTLRMVSILEGRLVGIEESERSRYLQYGLDYSESPLLRELKKSVRTASARATEVAGATTSPRDLIPWLDF